MLDEAGGGYDARVDLAAEFAAACARHPAARMAWRRGACEGGRAIPLLSPLSQRQLLLLLLPPPPPPCQLLLTPPADRLSASHTRTTGPWDKLCPRSERGAVPVAVRQLGAELC